MMPRFKDYFWTAFNARPIGMFVPPNWIGLAALGMIGLVNPGFWLLGMGLELGYLYSLISNRRFRNYVRGIKLSKTQADFLNKQKNLLAQLVSSDRERYNALQRRCQTILSQQRWNSGNTEMQAQSEGLGRLLWIYLRLLMTRHHLLRVLNESQTSGAAGSLQQRIAGLNERLNAPNISENLAKSLRGQIEIIQQRLEKQQEGKKKLEFLEAELTRIQEQAELIREQAVITADPSTVSSRIDQVAASLGGTTQWIHEQQQLYGQVEDLLTEPMPISVQPDDPPTLQAST